MRTTTAGAKSAFAVIAVACAAGAAAFALRALHSFPLAGNAGRLAAAVLTISAFSALNLSIRWVRWHFLARHMGLRMQARTSLAVFLVSLLALLTPFAVGEVGIGLFLRSYSKRPWLSASVLWILCRFGDVVAVGALLLCLNSGRWLLAGLLLITLTVVAAFHVPVQRAGGVGTLAVACLHSTASIAAWICPVAGLYLGARLLAVPIGFRPALDVFAGGTLSGAYVPAGIHVAAASMSRSLAALHGFSGGAAQVIPALRLGTVAFAVAVGLAAAVMNRRILAGLVNGTAPPVQSHFDELSPAYKEQIPDHVRAMLLDRKVELIVQALQRGGIAPGARGLDVGCGIGMYAVRLAQRGFRIVGCDPSSGQIRMAQREAARDAALEFRSGTLAEQRFPHDSFDFVYSVNVLHHVPSRAEQRKLLAEVARVLRPGGLFLLHEINVSNPLNRLYVSYAFPLLRRIDDGSELWLPPSELPLVENGRWADAIEYFTFVPDFVPRALLSLGAKVERAIAQTVLRRFSAHYMATFRKHPAGVQW